MTDDVMTDYDKTVYRTLVETGTVLNALVSMLASKGIIDLNELSTRAQDETAYINGVALEEDVARGYCESVVN